MATTAPKGMGNVMEQTRTSAEQSSMEGVKREVTMVRMGSLHGKMAFRLAVPSAGRGSRLLKETNALAPYLRRQQEGWIDVATCGR